MELTILGVIVQLFMIVIGVSLMAEYLNRISKSMAAIAETLEQLNARYQVTTRRR